MAIPFHPQPGQILHCDFSVGFKEPEMVKSSRPVVVLASRGQLVTVVAMSTVKPEPLAAFHLEMSKGELPQLGRFQEKDTWLKGDMIYTVGFHRLDLILLNKKDPATGKRAYFVRPLSLDRLREVKACVLHGLHLGMLVEHLPGQKRQSPQEGA